MDIARSRLISSLPYWPLVIGVMIADYAGRTHDEKVDYLLARTSGRFYLESGNTWSGAPMVLVEPYDSYRFWIEILFDTWQMIPKRCVASRAELSDLLKECDLSQLFGRDSIADKWTRRFWPTYAKQVHEMMDGGPLPGGRTIDFGQWNQDEEWILSPAEAGRAST